MTAAVLRKEIHNIVDIIPDRSLSALKPLLSHLANDYFVVEPASPKEAAMIDKRVKEYEKDPSCFVPFSRST